MRETGREPYRVSISLILTGVVGIIVLLASIVAVRGFIGIYRTSMEQNAITSSEQSVVQIENTIKDYVRDTGEIMSMISYNIGKEESRREEFFSNLLSIRSDVVAVTVYDAQGNLKSCWSGDEVLKEKVLQNLSYLEVPEGKEDFYISSPHVESLLVTYYPWVVTISKCVEDSEGEKQQIAMDIRFSNIAGYVDDVGIGQHGYCFIMDEAGNIVYHPQQQLIYCGLKEETTDEIKDLPDGSYTRQNTIYTIRTIERSGWRIVGVSFVDELVSSKVESLIRLVLMLVIVVLMVALLAGLFFSKVISHPADKLAEAMRSFEKDAENFTFRQVDGPREIAELSDSFGHMVVQIQGLMEKVRQEEISLRKTELNALQAQINPHFLYNTLDSIAWMCEEERTQEAVIMVNALAKLFRISISKGHELIPVEQECQHAENYLKIQKFRYKNQFSYRFDVQKECLQYLCNKITLQPIIENAIYHGLDMVEEGQICITIREDGDDILMMVEDNGVGMTEEKCAEILKKEPGEKGGIGIKNVHDRIRIYFGEQYGLTIHSELDRGTCVEIRMPKLLEGDQCEKSF